ncbi:MAG: lipopolysaccharide biosynthesis protein [Polyangia bacterium]
MKEPAEQPPDPSVRRPATAPLTIFLWERLRKLASLLRLKPFETSTESGRSLERYRRIALTTASGMVIRVFSSLLGLISVPLVLSYLGKERYGLWATITAVVAWASLFDLGLANGLVNLLSAAHGRDDKAEAQRHLSTAFAALVLMAAALSIVFLLGIGIVPWGKVIGARGVADESTIRWSIAASLLLFVVSLPFSGTAQVYAAYQRSYLLNGFVFGSAVLGFALLLLALRLHVTMPLLILMYGIGGPVCGAMAFLYATRKIMPWLRPRIRSISRQHLRALFSLSLPIFLFQIGALAVNNTQAIMLAHRCDMSVVASYSIAMRVYLLVITVVQIGTNSFVPALREAYERGDHDWTRRAFTRLVRLRLAITMGAGCAVILVGDTFLRLWLRRTDIAFGREVWAAIALLMVAATWTSSYSELLSIMDRLWLNVAAVLFNGTMILLLTYWLGRHYQVLGAFLAIALPTLLVALTLRVFGKRVLAENHVQRTADGADGAGT